MERSIAQRLEAGKLLAEQLQETLRIHREAHRALMGLPPQNDLEDGEKPIQKSTGPTSGNG